jgi:hypothetical protein
MPTFTSQNSKKVWFCLMGNVITMVLVLSLVCVFRSPKSTYFKFGPSPDLIVISVEIDTWRKWVLLNVFIWMVKGCEVLVNEIGSPILGFRVYNPDKKIIDDFSKNELHFLANAMWFVNGFRSVLMVVITITQADIAFSGMIVSEVVSIFTVRHLLNCKTFILPGDATKEIDDEAYLMTAF